ncbi:MAG: hypothetical protein HKN26_07340 [Acidimicrobiales bacterium]|nr:hypothetical protein [Acidimicrobiales bacterium]
MNSRLVLAVSAAILCTTGCGDDGPPTLDYPVSISNTGAELEGHTPAGFAGSGTGLLAGDNLDADFPDGEGVQFFVSFELPAGLEAGPTVLRSEALDEVGDPFEDLGALRAHPMFFDEFAPELYDQRPDGEGIACERADATTIECDVTPMLTNAVVKNRTHVQFRLRFDTPGDGDGEPDLARFFLTDPTTNEPGIFNLIVEAPSPAPVDGS